HDVTVLDNLIDGQISVLNHLCHDENFHFIKGDVRDEKLLEELIPQFDILIYLAGYVGESACKVNPWDTQSVNVEAVKTICRLKSKEQRLLFPMTNSGYGTTDGTVYCTEESPLNPISLYGRSKVEAEKIVIDTENSISFRLATVFGMSPKMRWELLVNFYVYEALRNRYLLIFEKNFKRNYVHVQDVADCFEFAINKTMKYKVYNLGLNDANLSKEELALKIKSHVPNLYIHFNDIETDIDKRNYIVSNDRILTEGFKPWYGLDAGIEELIKGYNLLGSSRPSRFNQ
ncbi:MAG: NAD-dependent epimerase/dehydratase family protein, partial [Chitinophagales bacterium]